MDEIEVYIRAEKVINSCTKQIHLDGAMKYVELVGNQYPQMLQNLINIIHKKFENL